MIEAVDGLRLQSFAHTSIGLHQDIYSAAVLLHTEFTIPLVMQVTAATREGDTVKLTVEPAKGGDSEILEADVVLVSAGYDFLLRISLQ